MNMNLAELKAQVEARISEARALSAAETAACFDRKVEAYRTAVAEETGLAVYVPRITGDIADLNRLVAKLRSSVDSTVIVRLNSEIRGLQEQETMVKQVLRDLAIGSAKALIEAKEAFDLATEYCVMSEEDAALFPKEALASAQALLAPIRTKATSVATVVKIPNYVAATVFEGKAASNTIGAILAMKNGTSAPKKAKKKRVSTGG